MKTSSKNIVAVDYGYEQISFGAILNGNAITTFDKRRFDLDLKNILALADRYASKHIIFTGPDTEFLPNQHGDIILEKRPRIDCLAQGLNFLITTGPTLVVLFELGCHLFYRGKETVYLGALPYSFSSFGLEEDVSISAEMGPGLSSALAVCQTHALPHTRVLDRYETLIAYTLALGIKEFTARYNLKTITIGGTITPEQKEILSSFLFPQPSPSTQISDFRFQSSLELPYPQHIAIFGMLSPYLENNAGEN